VPSALRCLSVAWVGCHELGNCTIYTLPCRLDAGFGVAGDRDWTTSRRMVRWLEGWEGYAGLITCNRKVQDTPPGLPVLCACADYCQCCHDTEHSSRYSYIPNPMQQLAYSVHAVASSLTVINDALTRMQRFVKYDGGKVVCVTLSFYRLLPCMQ
jgi:hypothetical protein